MSKRMTTTQQKTNLDSVTSHALFKATTQMTNEINDSVMKGFQNRNNPQTVAQASEFYMQGNEGITWTPASPHKRPFESAINFKF
jgi:hypothetical protein